jgi:hypothetical protein
VPGSALVPSSSTGELSRAERTALMSNWRRRSGAQVPIAARRAKSVERSASGQDVAIFVGRRGTTGPEQKGRQRCGGGGEQTPDG